MAKGSAAELPVIEHTLSLVRIGPRPFHAFTVFLASCRAGLIGMGLDSLRPYRWISPGALQAFADLASMVRVASVKPAVLLFNERLQIGRTIIASVPVVMVDVFTGLKRASISFFPHQAILSNVTRLLCKVMARSPHKPVALLVANASALPAVSTPTSRIVPVNVSERKILEVAVAAGAQSGERGSTAAPARAYSGINLLGPRPQNPIRPWLDFTFNHATPSACMAIITDRSQ